MKKVLGLAVLAAVVTTAIIFFARAGGAETSEYRFVTIERRDLEAVVSSTGTLSAVTTVEVGTQVSGQIAEIFVDFNDEVARGQLIARIDATLPRQAVRDAEATLERAQAELEQREREFERTARLHEVQGVTDSEYDTAEYNVSVARASLKSAEVSLERARNNLAYTRIYAPIDGVVIERNVDVGQTVAASLSAPQLFLIANDLSQMEILASVDESDIGRIEPGQAARFTVQAYPDETFLGTVRQVRLQSSSEENVVNYTVVVSVENPDGRLLPGMTATVDFLIETATGVLAVPNAALRFRPNAQMLTEFRERMRAQAQQARATGSDSGPAPGLRRAAAGRDSVRDERRPTAAGAGRNLGQLWYLGADGELAVARIQIGISDGQFTEIRGPGMEEGMRVIAGITRSEQPTIAPNPFQPQGPGGARRGRDGP